MNIYDMITADQIEEGDQILFSNDPIEVKEVIDSQTAIMVKGYSHLSGDSVAYLLNPDAEVELWTA